MRCSLSEMWGQGQCIMQWLVRVPTNTTFLHTVTNASEANIHKYKHCLSIKPRKNSECSPCQSLNVSHLGKVSQKKVAVLLDFVPMRGERGPCPNFLSTFQKLYILSQFGDGEGGGDPGPNFLAHWRSKKVVQVVQIRGRGGEEGPCPNFLSPFHKCIFGQ